MKLDLRTGAALAIGTMVVGWIAFEAFRSDAPAPRRPGCAGYATEVAGAWFGTIRELENRGAWGEHRKALQALRDLAEASPVAATAVEIDPRSVSSKNEPGLSLAYSLGPFVFLETERPGAGANEPKDATVWLANSCDDRRFLHNGYYSGSDKKLVLRHAPGSDLYFIVDEAQEVTELRVVP